MTGRDLQRARKTAARQKEDAFVALKMRNADLEATLRDLLATGPGTDNAPYEDRQMVAMHIRWGAYKAALAAVGIVR
jgi:hypothetical protein